MPSGVIEFGAAPTVQNGTPVTTTGWESYAEKFTSLRKGTAEAVLDLAAILVDAEGNLSKKDFGSFCGEAEIDKGKSYHKKLRTIGKNAARLKPHLELLPHCWTTIYKLAQMKADEFQKLVESRILSPKTTAADIREFLAANGSGATKRPMDPAQRVIISFRRLNDDAKIRVAAEIMELAGNLPVAASSHNVAEICDPRNIAA